MAGYRRIVVVDSDVATIRCRSAKAKCLVVSLVRYDVDFEQCIRDQ